MPDGLVRAIELSFDGRYVDDVLVALRGSRHERLETRVDDEGCDRVYQMHFQQLNGGDFGHQESPGVAAAQIDLLEILVEKPLWEEADFLFDLARQHRELGVFLCLSELRQT